MTTTVTPRKDPLLMRVNPFLAMLAIFIFIMLVVSTAFTAVRASTALDADMSVGTYAGCVVESVQKESLLLDKLDTSCGTVFVDAWTRTTLGAKHDIVVTQHGLGEITKVTIAGGAQ